MRREFVFVLILLLFTSFVHASFDIDDELTSIDSTYFSGESVRGTLAIELEDHPNAKFSAKFGGNLSHINVSILEVFEEMNLARGVSYSCDPSSCRDHFTTMGFGSTQTSFEIEEGNERYFGFKLLGDPVREIDQFYFNITSNAGPSCGNQILLDMFDDGSINYFNQERTNVVCPLDETFFGCFRDDEWQGEEGILDSDPYCEQIELLPAAAGYSLEASVKKISVSGSDRLQLSIYDLDNDQNEICTINPVETVSVNDFTDINCIANYSTVLPIRAFVCIEQTGGTGEYVIKTETSRACGGNLPSDFDSFTPTRDFDLKVRPMQYDSFGSQRISVASYGQINNDDSDLIDQVNAYITEVYGNNCSSSGGGCVIPFSVTGVSQSASLHDGRVRFREGAGEILTSVNTFYELEKSDFTISANETIIDISKMGFVVPQIEDEQLFTLFFGGSKVAEASIQVDVGFDFYIGPEFALIGQDTTFTAFTTDDDETIVSTVWGFGDGSTSVSSQSNQASHRYLNESTYTVEVRATNGLGEQSTKQFTVVVGEAEQSLNQTLIDYRTRIGNVKADIATLPQSLQDEVSTLLEVDDLEADVLSIQNRYAQLGSGVASSQYISLINELFILDVPYSVGVRESGQLPGDVGYTNIDARHIKDISADDSADATALKNSIIAWMNDNYALQIKYDTYSALFETGEESLLTYYDISVDQLSSSAEDASLIINYPRNNIFFIGAYNDQPASEGSAAFIDLYSDDVPESIRFYILGETAPSVASLGVYISPDTDYLDSSGNGPVIPVIKEGFNWTRFIFGMIIVFAIILTLYVLLQSWYKKYYESHLFRNPDDLYNIINFIYNSRKNGLSDSETRKALLEKRWKGEQVSYAFKKIDGKRTGLWEIPLFKFIENKKVKKELEKKQGGKIDARFIKRPSLY